MMRKTAIAVAVRRRDRSSPPFRNWFRTRTILGAQQGPHYPLTGSSGLPWPTGTPLIALHYSNTRTSSSIDASSSGTLVQQQQPQILSLEQQITLLNDLTPGCMDHDTWQKARGLIPACAQQRNDKGAKMAQHVLERLLVEAKLQPPHNNMRVNATLYNICLDAWIKAREHACTDNNNASWTTNDVHVQVEALFQRIKSLAQTLPASVVEPPDTISYNTLLHAWSVSFTGNSTINTNNNTNNNKIATQRVEAIISEMEQLSLTNPTGHVHPDSISYHLVIQCYANRVGEYGSAKAAEDWLLRLSELNLERGGGGGDTNDKANGNANESIIDIGPSTYHFNAVLKAWANSGEAKGPERASEILVAMISLFQKGHENACPDRVSFSTVATAFAKRNDPVSAEQAEEVLRLMETLEFPLDHPGDGLDMTSCFNSVMNAWAKSGATNAGERAQQLLNRAVSFSKNQNSQDNKEDRDASSNKFIQPDIIMYNCCLEAHATNSGPEKVDEFLRAMLESSELGNGNNEVVVPDTITFNRAISKWVQSGQPKAADKAEAWLLLMDGLAAKRKLSRASCRPNLLSYNFCIDGWTRDLKSVDAPTRALALLERMQGDDDNKVRPDSFSYHNVMKGMARLSRKGVKGATAKVVEVFEQMEEDYFRGNQSARPDAISANLVLQCLASHKGSKKAAEQALALIHRMEEMYESGNRTIQPNLRSYTCVLEAWTNNYRDVRAQNIAIELFDRMIQLDGDNHRELRLDKKAFLLIFQLLADINKTVEDAAAVAEHAHRIFDTMMDMHRAGHELVQPGTSCFTACLLAVAHHPHQHGEGNNGKIKNDAGSSANQSSNSSTSSSSSSSSAQEKMLASIVRMHRDGVVSDLPNRAGFGAVIGACYANNNSKNAEVILNLMKELARNGHPDLQPDLSIYTASIGMLTKQGKPECLEQAESILLATEEERRNGNLRTGADMIAWNSVIGGWARMNVPGKARRARHILDQMNDIWQNEKTRPTNTCAVRPDLISYNTVLNAAVFTRGTSQERDEALRIGLCTMKELKQLEHVKPDHITYGSMVKLLKFMMQRGDQQLNAMKCIFEECCSEGQVGKTVVKEMCHTFSPDQRRQLFGDSIKDYSPTHHRQSLPASWTRNLRER